MDQAKKYVAAFSTMSANKYLSIIKIIDEMYQAKTMLPHFYFVCKKKHVSKIKDEMDQA